MIFPICRVLIAAENTLPSNIGKINDPAIKTREIIVKFFELPFSNGLSSTTVFRMRLTSNKMIDTVNIAIVAQTNTACNTCLIIMSPIDWGSNLNNWVPLIVAANEPDILADITRSFSGINSRTIFAIKKRPNATTVIQNAALQMMLIL